MKKKIFSIALLVSAQAFSATPFQNFSQAFKLYKVNQSADNLDTLTVAYQKLFTTKDRSGKLLALPGERAAAKKSIQQLGQEVYSTITAPERVVRQSEDIKKVLAELESQRVANEEKLKQAEEDAKKLAAELKKVNLQSLAALSPISALLKRQDEAKVLVNDIVAIAKPYGIETNKLQTLGLHFATFNPTDKDDQQKKVAIETKFEEITNEATNIDKQVKLAVDRLKKLNDYYNEASQADTKSNEFDATLKKQLPLYREKYEKLANRYNELLSAFKKPINDQTQVLSPETVTTLESAPKEARQTLAEMQKLVKNAKSAASQLETLEKSFFEAFGNTAEELEKENPKKLADWFSPTAWVRGTFSSNILEPYKDTRNFISNPDYSEEQRTQKYDGMLSKIATYMIDEINKDLADAINKNTLDGLNKATQRAEKFKEAYPKYANKIETLLQQANQKLASLMPPPPPPPFIVEPLSVEKFAKEVDDAITAGDKDKLNKLKKQIDALKESEKYLYLESSEKINEALGIKTVSAENVEPTAITFAHEIANLKLLRQAKQKFQDKESDAEQEQAVFEALKAGADEIKKLHPTDNNIKLYENFMQEFNEKNFTETKSSFMYLYKEYQKLEQGSAQK